jgi:hypothetical protein
MSITGETIELSQKRDITVGNIITIILKEKLIGDHTKSHKI